MYAKYLLIVLIFMFVALYLCYCTVPQACNFFMGYTYSATEELLLLL